MKRLSHPIPPIYDKESEVLILGSFPSVKSRAVNFYYGHSQNQFWSLLKDVFNEEINDKKAFLLKHHIALWDVIKSCEIEGSQDSKIRNVKVNNINKIIKESKIKTIFTTGKTATNLYHKYIESKTKIKSIYLPSTSPLYRILKYEEKLKSYQQIKKYLS